MHSFQLSPKASRCASCVRGPRCTNGSRSRSVLAERVGAAPAATAQAGLHVPALAAESPSVPVAKG